MAKRKSKYDDFITMCEKNRKLYALATTSTPSCNRYDVIDGNFVIPEKSASHKKSSSRRIAKSDAVFIAYRFRGYPTKEQEAELKQNIGAARFMWNRMLSDYNLMWKELDFTIIQRKKLSHPPDCRCFLKQETGTPFLESGLICLYRSCI